MPVAIGGFGSNSGMFRRGSWRRSEDTSGSSTLPSLPSIPGGGGGGTPAAPAAAPFAPPPVTSTSTTATAPAELTNYASEYEKALKEFESGADKASKASMESMNADIERQVQQARENAASTGQPFDEAKMRAELARGKFGAVTKQGLERSEAALGARTGGLGIIQAPSQTAQAQTSLNLQGQKSLMDYWLGQGQYGLGLLGAQNEANRTAMQGWTALLSAANWN